jgi:hypothetical protein
MIDLQHAISTLPTVDPQQLRSIQANPEDVSTPDSIIDALWASYSARAGERDWDRLRSLFYPTTGSSMVAHPTSDGGVNMGILRNHDAYRDWCADIINDNNLFEWQLKRRIQRWGHVAHVVASVVVADEPDEEPFGLSLQNIFLYWDENRWWILSILIDIITPENPFPAEFLPNSPSDG